MRRVVDQEPSTGFLFSPCSKQKKATSTLRNRAQSKGTISGGKEAERQQLMAHISNELRPLHPLSYDAFNLCECARDNKLSLFNVSLLKEILRFFEIPLKSRDRKKDLIEQLMSFIQECQCFNEV